MFSTGTGVFLHIPDESAHRVLHPATVAEAQEDSHTAELEEGHPPVEAGQEVIVYFERHGEFMKQPARIEAVLQTEPSTMLGFTLRGEAVSAEQRQCYRVSTVVAGLSAEFGNEEHCPLLEVSMTGFSLLANEAFKVGEFVPATLYFEGETFPGTACVQNARPGCDGQFRYGLQCINERGTTSPLQLGLRHISATMQRRHLRRLARGA